jgi:ribosomal protein S18 acetylase RimI-like enzyme
MIEIRPATPGDAPQLADLRWEFRAGRATPTEEHAAFVARCAAWMAAELAAGDRWRAWVAQDGASLVGQVWLDIIQKMPNPIQERERHAYLSNLYVTPSARGGLGTQLLRAALAHASAEGVDRLVLWPSPRSRSLYVRHGFTQTGQVLELNCSVTSR